MPKSATAMLILLAVIITGCNAATTATPGTMPTSGTTKAVQGPATETPMSTATETPAATTPDQPQPESAAPLGCGDFDNWEDAHQWFLEHGGPESDPYYLDTDSDAIPCNAATDQGADTQFYTAPEEERKTQQTDGN